MTVHYTPKAAIPSLRVKQTLIHQCLFLLPLLCVVIALKTLEYSLDIPLAQHFKNLRFQLPMVNMTMRIISKYTSLLILGFYAYNLYRCYRQKKFTQLRFLFASLVVYYTLLSCTLYVLKVGVGMPRPYAEPSKITPFSFDSDYHSFPSGHTAECAAITSTLAHFFNTYFATFSLGCLLAMVAFSRVFCSMHHPLDLLPGALLGSLAPLIAAPLVHKRFWHRLPQSTFFTGTPPASSRPSSKKKAA